MRQFAKTMMVVGALLVGGYFLNDQMDAETALSRYGHSDGRSAITTEVLVARDTWIPDEVSPWVVGTGFALLFTGFLINRREGR